MPEVNGLVTDADWRAAQARRNRAAKWTAVGALLGGIGLNVLIMELADVLADGRMRILATLGLLLVVLGPMVVVVVRYGATQQDKTDRLVETLTQQLAESVELAAAEASDREVHAQRQQFESRLANALDMAEGEPEVIDVIERSMGSTMPESPVELLLADNSHAHLLRMASASPTTVSPGCGVDSPDHCPAARRAQVQRFADSDDLDACPKLRGRAEGAISAVCVPVAIMGRTVGVIHSTAPPQATFAEDSVQELETLAALAGARIGLMRVMAETQLQASTDSLTGLANRRSFEQRLSATRHDGVPLTLAMADLDQFKELNDTHGHDTGDRALRLFAQVLAASLRSQDLTCRHGGEEFVMALNGCTTDSARPILDAVRGRLAAAITVAGLPSFTVSLGAVQAHAHEDLPTTISRADAALLQAKHDGRDRLVVHDAQGITVPAPITGPPRLPTPTPSGSATHLPD